MDPNKTGTEYQQYKQDVDILVLTQSNKGAFCVWIVHASKVYRVMVLVQINKRTSNAVGIIYKFQFTKKKYSQ